MVPHNDEGVAAASNHPPKLNTHNDTTIVPNTGRDVYTAVCTDAAGSPSPLARIAEASKALAKVGVFLYQTGDGLSRCPEDADPKQVALVLASLAEFLRGSGLWVTVMVNDVTEAASALAAEGQHS